MIDFLVKFLVSRDEVYKLAKQFKFLDRNGDGVLSREEFIEPVLDFELNVLTLAFDTNTLCKQSSVDKSYW